MSDDRLAKIVFNWDYNRNNNNWSYEIGHLFHLINMQETFEQLNLCDMEIVQQRFETEICSCDWIEGVRSKPKLRTYLLFKENYETEKYVQYCDKRNERSLLAQIRLGVLPLHIETGRFESKQIEERVCKICNSGEVEDEIHFMCVCQKYVAYRNVLYQKAAEKNSDFINLDIREKFVYLFRNCWREVGKYLSQSWRERTNTLYTEG